MSIQPLILKNGVNTYPRSPTDVSALLASIGLNNVNNTSDLNKPISILTQAALDLKANITSPNLSGTPTAPTANTGTSNTQIATTAFVTNAVSAISTSSFVDLTTNQTINGVKIFSGSLQLPTVSGSTAGTIWRNGNNLEYKDGANVTKIILNSAGNLSNLMDKQVSLNNLVGTQTANRVLRSDGTNVTLSQVNLSTDVTNTLPIASGGTGSNTQNFVDLTTAQTIGGAKTFSGSPIIITATTTGTGGTGSVLKVVQTGAWSANSPYVLEVVGYSYLDGFRITGQGGARGIYQIGSGLQLDFATNAGDITFTSGTTGGVERMRVYTSDGRVRIFSTTATTSTTTGALTVAGGAGFGGGICATLPTSSTGLASGMMWRNGNVVNIV